MLKILFVGNSFYQNAQMYLYQFAYVDRFSMKTANMYIGVCLLETHCENIKGHAKKYMLWFNGCKRFEQQGVESIGGMSKKVFECYREAAEKINADGLAKYILAQIYHPKSSESVLH